MRPDIIIPTIRSADELRDLLGAVGETAPGCRIIPTCLPVCAAANRNAGLDRAATPIVVMIDDDVSGFPPGWAGELAEVLERDDDCVMVSARLLNPDGTPGQMLGHPDTSVAEGLVVVPRRELPTACIAIRNDGTRFDEGYAGSGWEDTDFCARLRGIYPKGKFIVHRGVSVIHANEQKRQGENFRQNRRRYEEMWGKHPHFVRA